MRTHKCKLGTGYSGYYRGFLVEASPDILWYYVVDVGGYQGTIYAVGKYKGKALIFEDDYGSCSGCGAWEEGDDITKYTGGQPKNLEEIMRSSVMFDNRDKALEHIDQIRSWGDELDKEPLRDAVKEILTS